jgi:hypothetical protein
MTLRTEVTDSLAGVDPAELFALDPTLGALGSPGRLEQHSHDPRWTPRFVLVRQDGALRAALPIFLGHGLQWSDQIHNPQDWGHPHAPTPDKSALVGGRLEIRGSLRCAADPAVLAAVADGLADVPELAGRELFLGYLAPDQRELAERIFGPIDWLAAADDFTFPEPVVRGSLMDLPQPVRYTIRHGERKIAERDVLTEVSTWTEHDGAAGELIAEHNERKGQPDHPELVRYRMDRWAECPEVTPLVVEAIAGAGPDALAGAATLLLYRDEVEIYEVGIPDDGHPDRHDLYLHLTFHEPRRIAQERGARLVRSGFGAPRPKLLRGAQAVARHSGRLTGR